MGKIVVVGGHSRNIGKTSAVAGIISATRQLDWTAVKITQFGHGICSINGEDCHCSTEQHRFAIQQEKEIASGTDSSRFLAAGAKRALWVRTKQGMLFEAMPSLRELIRQDPFVIFESNSLMRFLRPDVYVVLLDYATLDFKASVKQFIDLADAYLIIRHGLDRPVWRDVSLKPMAGKPVFEVASPDFISPAVVEFVKGYLQ